ncbi:MAG: ATP-dependent Clp protease ATP-binding subunit [Planctomycetes bacterium]|nr:ATP-dependent Clp protease ATP-binding subunit [Planctomycetota bacterium]
MFDKFSDRARKVMSFARQEAQRMAHEYIGTEHILLGLLLEGTGVAARVLRNMDIDFEHVREKIESIIMQEPAPNNGIINKGHLPFTPGSKRVLDLAQEEAMNMGSDFVGTEHLLLALLRETGVATQVLVEMGVKLEDVREEVLEVLGASEMHHTGDARTRASSKTIKSKTPALDAFGRDLTELAKEQKLDPVIGRKREIERVIQVLCRRTKNNPVLLGEAGVGKTAIVEGLAQDIIASKVPEILRERRIVVLDLASMVAGTKYRGQFEERIKAVMNEVKKSKNIILFIDELHTLVGAGGAEGAIDASNVLKPALARGEVQCIGATTLDEYRKYIEKDGALERRFQTIMVDPPSRFETFEILKGLRDKYETHHRVRYTDVALEACVELSNRYISGRFQPDKAIDVLDESGARVRLQTMSKPPDLSNFDREMAKLDQEKTDCIANQDFERAALLRDSINKLKKKKDEAQKDWTSANKETESVVDENLIAETVSRMTGIPLSRLEKKEAERLLKMEDEVHKMVVSQEDAISAIARAIRRSRSGLKEPRKPIGTFIFVGPSGCGKTLMAKALAKFMFGEEDALLQIDMSEYMEKHNVSRLVGAPPGYVGYEEGGQLTERIRRRPYAVVLLDEIEKAHMDVFNMLLQIMEEGRLTDSFGRHIDFKNVILIMTSNIGADVIKNQSTLGFKKTSGDSSYESMKDLLLKEVEKHFRPEFLNRLDDIIVFKPLTKKDLKQVIEIEMQSVKLRLKDREYSLVLSDEAADFLIEKGYNPDFGARPIKRSIERYVEDPLSEAILRGEFKGPCDIVITVKDDHLYFESRSGEKRELQETVGV